MKLSNPLVRELLVRSYWQRTVNNFLIVEKTDKYSAIKIINKIQLKKKPFLKKYIDQEIDIMSKLNHPNIVRY